MPESRSLTLLRPWRMIIFFEALACVALSCRDASPVQPRILPPVAANVTDLVFVSRAHVDCQRRRGNAPLKCVLAEPPSPKSNVAANIVLAQNASTFDIAFQGVTYDDATRIFSITADILNRLGQPMGTLDGTTATGVKLFIASGPVATSGSGTVTVANADGTDSFTAPSQPYWLYNQLIPVGVHSATRQWDFLIQDGVYAFGFEVNLYAAVPAERDVAIQPPDTMAAWVNSLANASTAGGAVGMRFARNVLKVMFRPNTLLADRQRAVAIVGGTVVGGLLFGSTDGLYILQVADSGSGVQLIQAADKLGALPQVLQASPVLIFEQTYRKPNDGANWRAWRTNPDSVDLNSKALALEMIGAPMAWGCSTGNSTTRVGIVDAGFHTTNIVDLQGPLSGNSAINFAGDVDEHGTYVASVVAAEGNNGLGMTGTMWQAALQVEDERLDPNHLANGLQAMTQVNVSSALGRLIQRDVPVINLSFGFAYRDSVTNAYRQPGSYARDSMNVVQWSELLPGYIRQQAVGHQMPLLVIAAGNFGQPGANATTDSWWSGMPVLRDSMPSTVLVVGASTRQRSVAWFSGANTSTHQYVELMAPGDGVYVLNSAGVVDSVSGTSVAAPFATGVAGLAVAFDPTVVGTDAVELKRLILAGADSSRDSQTNAQRRVTGNGGPYRLLNAYETLKEAARRPGAPLCANRVWAQGGQIYAERGTPTGPAQELFNAQSPISSLISLHGGKQVLYSIGGPQRAISWQSGGSWTDGPAPTGSVAGGTDNSIRHYSHDRDSTVTANPAAGVSFQVSVAPVSGPSHVIATLEGLAPASTSTCAYELLQGGVWTCQSSINYQVLSEPQGFGNLNAVVAFGAQGERVLVAIPSRRKIATESWVKCFTLMTLAASF